MLARLFVRPPADPSAGCSSCTGKKSIGSIFFAPLRHSRQRSSQKITGIVATTAACGGRRQATALIYLVVDALAVESYVNGEGGGVVVRDEQWLLVGLVPHHKVQRGGALTERRHVGQQEDRRG